MYFVKPLFIIGVAVCGLQIWHQCHAMRATESATSRADENGFAYMPPVEGQKANTVYVVVSPDRSARDAWLAVRLADDLSEQGIPVVRTSRVTFAPVGLVGLNDTGVDHISALMSGPSPIVFVDGKAKTAATLEQVQAELKRGTAPLVRTAFSWR